MTTTLELDRDQDIVSHAASSIITNENNLIDLIAQHSMAIEIGTDLLNIEPTDGTTSICKKMNKACRSHPEHLAEIMLTGLMSVVFKSETKQETVDGFIFAIGLADRVLAH